MYCPHCGKEVTAGKFCQQCGKELNTPDAQVKKPMTFDDFLSRKKKSRVNFYHPKKQDKRSVQEATIYASIMRNVDGKFKQDRGTRLPVIVNVDWSAPELKSAVYKKMIRYHTYVADYPQSDYKLIYKNGEVIRNIPGTDIPFTVGGYKTDLGVGFQNIIVYLMLYECISDDDGEYGDLPDMSCINSTSTFETDSRYYFFSLAPITLH